MAANEPRRSGAPAGGASTGGDWGWGKTALAMLPGGMEGFEAAERMKQSQQSQANSRDYLGMMEERSAREAERYSDEMGRKGMAELTALARMGDLPGANRVLNNNPHLRGYLQVPEGEALALQRREGQGAQPAPSGDIMPGTAKPPGWSFMRKDANGVLSPIQQDGHVMDYDDPQMEKLFNHYNPGAAQQELGQQRAAMEAKLLPLQAKLKTLMGNIQVAQGEAKLGFIEQYQDTLNEIEGIKVGMGLTGAKGAQARQPATESAKDSQTEIQDEDLKYMLGLGAKQRAAIGVKGDWYATGDLVYNRKTGVVKDFSGATTGVLSSEQMGMLREMNKNVRSHYGGTYDDTTDKWSFVDKEGEKRSREALQLGEELLIYYGYPPNQAMSQATKYVDSALDKKANPKGMSARDLFFRENPKAGRGSGRSRGTRGPTPPKDIVNQGLGKGGGTKRPGPVAPGSKPYEFAPTFNPADAPTTTTAPPAAPSNAVGQAGDVRAQTKEVEKFAKGYDAYNTQLTQLTKRAKVMKGRGWPPEKVKEKIKAEISRNTANLAPFTTKSDYKFIQAFDQGSDKTVDYIIRQLFAAPQGPRRTMAQR